MREQLQLLGVAWPPEKGWRERVIGTHITAEDARAFIELAAADPKKLRNRRPPALLPLEKPTAGLCCDASCRGNNGREYFSAPVEWRVVDITTGEILYSSPTYQDGTINLAEFLGLASAVAILHNRGDHTTPIFCDSRTALSWYTKRKIRSRMPRTEHTAPLIDKAEAAMQWIERNNPRNPVHKWDTEAWGEVPADYGRK